METMQSKSERFQIGNPLPVIDQFISALEHRLGAYELISSRFGFLRKLDALSSQEIMRATSILFVVYNDDLDVCIGNELVHFIEFVNAFKDEQNEGVSRANFMYQLIFEKQVQGVLPNVEIALCMYLVEMVSNCNAVRSFSKFKLMKNRLRTFMCSDRLSQLALVSIEADILREIIIMSLI